jgi:hypothetical protein
MFHQLDIVQFESGEELVNQSNSESTVAESQAIEVNSSPNKMIHLLHIGFVPKVLVFLQTVDNHGYANQICSLASSKLS